MRLVILTLFPEMVLPFFETSILKKARDKGIFHLEIVNWRNFAIDRRGTVDDKVYGGGRGMLLMIEPIAKALKSIRTTNSHVLLTGPRGQRFNQNKAQQYALAAELVIVCGHYEGFDERIYTHIDEEVSLGDFINTGGEPTALAISDAVIRLLPGVLDQSATANESFMRISLDELIKIVGETSDLIALKKRGCQEVNLLEYPQYTNPVEFEGIKVPEILLSGHHGKINKWRLEQAYKITKQQRPDLLLG